MQRRGDERGEDDAEGGAGVALEAPREGRAKVRAKHKQDRQREPVAACQPRDLGDRGRDSDRQTEADRVPERARAQCQVGAQDRPGAAHPELRAPRPCVAHGIGGRPLTLPGRGQIDRAAEVPPYRRASSEHLFELGGSQSLAGGAIDCELVAQRGHGVVETVADRAGVSLPAPEFERFRDGDERLRRSTAADVDGTPRHDRVDGLEALPRAAERDEVAVRAIGLVDEDAERLDGRARHRSRPDRRIERLTRFGVGFPDRPAVVGVRVADPHGQCPVDPGDCPALGQMSVGAPGHEHERDREQTARERERGALERVRGVRRRARDDGDRERRRQRDNICRHAERDEHARPEARNREQRDKDDGAVAGELADEGADRDTHAREQHGADPAAIWRSRIGEADQQRSTRDRHRLDQIAGRGADEQRDADTSANRTPHCSFSPSRSKRIVPRRMLRVAPTVAADGTESRSCGQGFATELAWCAVVGH